MQALCEPLLGYQYTPSLFDSADFGMPVQNVEIPKSEKIPHPIITEDGPFIALNP